MKKEYEFGTKRLDRIARDLINNRQNTLLDAPAGTGKTTFARSLKEKGELEGFKVLLTAVTGVAADKINGVTISSACHLKTYNLEDHEIMTACDMDTNLSSTRILVIDEVSMLTPEQLRQIDLACRAAKCDEKKPFGGITVLLMGDHCQLEPIDVLDDKTIVALDSVFSESFKFKSLGFKKKTLTQIFRQKDELSLRFLSELRMMISNESVDQNLIQEIKAQLASTTSKGVSIYSNVKDLPSEDLAPDRYYFPTGNAPYVSLPICYGYEYLVTRNIDGYFNGKTVFLEFEKEEMFLVQNFKDKKVRKKNEQGEFVYFTEKGDLDAEYLALLPLVDMTTRRVQGSTFESGLIASEFFNDDNRVRLVSELGWLKTLYTALGRFTDVSNVSLC